MLGYVVAVWLVAIVGGYLPYAGILSVQKLRKGRTCEITLVYNLLAVVLFRLHEDTTELQRGGWARLWLQSKAKLSIIHRPRPSICRPRRLIDCK